MSFAQFSFPLAIAGLAAIAGVLFLLQRLRVRHKPVTVVTTLFWREAVEETRARVLTQRFRHIWAYLLALLIAGVIWMAMAEPEFGTQPDRDTVVLLDASAGMARADRFDRTRDVLLEYLDTAPIGRRVVHCGGVPVTVLSPGEDPLLLEERLRDETPSASPSTIETVVRDLVRNGVDRPLELVVFSDREISDDFRALLPEGVTLTRKSASNRVPSEEENWAITALGVSEAQSGAWDQVDVLVRVRSSGGDSEVPALRAQLDGAPLTETASEQSVVDGEVRTVFRDLPAKGGRLQVEIDGTDANALDQRAAIVLPRRPVIRVALTPSLDAVIRPVLAADPGIRVADGEADVSIHRVGEASPAGIPSLRFVPEESQDEAFLVSYAPGVSYASGGTVGTSEEVDQVELSRAFRELGLEHIDAQALAEETARPIRLGIQARNTASVEVWESLLSGDYDFIDSRAFPIFVARSVRYLAGVEPVVSFAAAGEPLPVTGARTVIDSQERHDPIGAPFVPPTATTYEDSSGRTLAVSLLDPETTLAPAVVAGAGGGSSEGSSLPAWSWLALLALTGVMVEWFLHRNGRMP